MFYSRAIMQLALATLLVLLANGAAEAKRVALIIGNDQYVHLEGLKKAVADAKTYAEVLKTKGFDQVTLKTDLNREAMDEAIAAFMEEIEPGDTALFAYSGHGWSDGTQDYIVGTDAPRSGSLDLLGRISISLKNGTNGIIDEMDQKGASLKIVIIDACRDNPFTPLTGKKGLGLTRGLAVIVPPSGTFVVFSASAGQAALDLLSASDKDPNSVFTRVFAPLLRSDLNLQEAVKEAQRQVVTLAHSINEMQQPAYYDEVVGSVCLTEHCQSPGMPKVGGASPSSPEVSGQDIEKLSASVSKFKGNFSNDGAEYANNDIIDFFKRNDGKIVYMDTILELFFLPSYNGGAKAVRSIYQQCNFDQRSIFAGQDAFHASPAVIPKGEIPLPIRSDGRNEETVLTPEEFENKDVEVDCQYGLIFEKLKNKIQASWVGTGYIDLSIRGFFEVSTIVGYHQAPGPGTVFRLKEWEAPLALRLRMSQ